MFQFYNIPRVNYSYYRPTIYRRRYDQVESYLLNSFRRAQEIEILKSFLYNSIKHQQSKDISSKAETPQTEEETSNHKPYEINETTEIKQKQSLPSPVYYFESHSKFEGDKIIEERKERIIDNEGKIHEKLKRRLGDQWYETEQIEDQEGHIENKETWHNVSEEDIESFKKEWISKSGQKLQLTINSEEQNQEEIKNEKDDEEIKNDQNKTENKDHENENCNDIEIMQDKEEKNDVILTEENVKQE